MLPTCGFPSILFGPSISRLPLQARSYSYQLRQRRRSSHARVRLCCRPWEGVEFIQMSGYGHEEHVDILRICRHSPHTLKKCPGQDVRAGTNLHFEFGAPTFIERFRPVLAAFRVKFLCIQAIDHVKSRGRVKKHDAYGIILHTRKTALPQFARAATFQYRRPRGSGSGLNNSRFIRRAVLTQ
jgi:hypothetical protein